MHGGFVQEGSGDPLCLAGRRTEEQKHVNVVVGAANLIGSPHTLRANASSGYLNSLRSVIWNCRRIQVVACAIVNFVWRTSRINS